jgi:hypothetical protein
LRFGRFPQLWAPIPVAVAGLSLIVLAQQIPTDDGAHALPATRQRLDSIGSFATPVLVCYGWAWMREMVLVVWLVAQIAVPAGAIA